MRYDVTVIDRSGREWIGRTDLPEGHGYFDAALRRFLGSFPIKGSYTVRFRPVAPPRPADVHNGALWDALHYNP